MSEIAGTSADWFIFDDIGPDPEMVETTWKHTDYLGHHARMVRATNKIKTRRDLVDDLLK